MSESLDDKGTNTSVQGRGRLRDRLKFHAIVDSGIIIGALVLSHERHSIIERIVGGVVMSVLFLQQLN